MGLPPGAQISSATQCEVHGIGLDSQTDACIFDIRAEAADNAGAFTVAGKNLSARADSTVAVGGVDTISGTAAKVPATVTYSIQNAGTAALSVASPVWAGALAIAGGGGSEGIFGIPLSGTGQVAPAWNFTADSLVVAGPLADVKRNMVLAVTGETLHGIRASVHLYGIGY